MNQTKNPRGGGSGGLGKKFLAKKWDCGCNANCAGGNKIIFPATGGNSSFKFVATAADFFSEFFAAAMALHNGQRCRPSNVSDTASVSDCWLERLAASIVVHATVCSAAQCAPVVTTSAATTKNFPKRASTDEI